MNLNITQNAIISVLHQEPWYRFLGNERRVAERMQELGYLKPLKSTPFMAERGVKERGGLRFSVTKKGEQVYMEDNAELNILNRQWSVPIVENDRTVGLVSLDVSRFEIRGYEGVWIARIKTPVAHQRKGHAKRAMEALLKVCRFNGVDVYLAINEYGSMTFKQLFDWYERLGFKQIKGEERGFMRYACSPLYR